MIKWYGIQESITFIILINKTLFQKKINDIFLPILIEKCKEQKNTM